MILENWRYSNSQRIIGYVEEAKNIKPSTVADKNWEKSVVGLFLQEQRIVVFSGGRLVKSQGLSYQILPPIKYAESHAVYDFNFSKSAERFHFRIVENNKTPIFVVHLLDSNAIASQISLEIGAKAYVEINEVFIALPGAKKFVTSKTDMNIASQGVLDYNIIGLFDKNCRFSHFLTLEQMENSTAKIFNASLGGEWSRYDVRVELKEKGASIKSGGLYLPSDTEFVDHCTRITHAAPETTSDQLYKGVLAGSSRSIFNGVIRIDKDCPNSKANQLNRNLLVSKKAEAISRPQLEILTDNVKANHGMTIGNLNPDEIFYLQSRGLDAVTAHEILADAFLNEVVENYVNPSMERVLRGKLQERWEPIRGALA